MLLQELFSIEDVLVGFDAADKWEALTRLLDHLVERGRLPEEEIDTLKEAVFARERSMSTGMERGIAIPHAAVDGIEKVVACLGIVPGEGLNFESVDGSPTRLVVMLLIPRSQKLLHISTLADVARVLRSESVRQALLASETSRAAWDCLSEGAAH